MFLRIITLHISQFPLDSHCRQLCPQVFLKLASCNEPPFPPPRIAVQCATFLIPTKSYRNHSRVCAKHLQHATNHETNIRLDLFCIVHIMVSFDERIVFVIVTFYNGYYIWCAKSPSCLFPNTVYFLA